MYYLITCQNGHASIDTQILIYQTLYFTITDYPFKKSN